MHRFPATFGINSARTSIFVGLSSSKIGTETFNPFVLAISSKTLLSKEVPGIYYELSAVSDISNVFENGIVMRWFAGRNALIQQTFE